MKKTLQKSFFLAVLLITANVFVTSAQSKFLNIYRNGSVEYIKAVSDVDSITFATLPSVASGQVIIKELYNGGCQKLAGEGTGTGAFNSDQYVVLYNNSNQTASLENLAFGYLLPNNAQANNGYYVDGSLYYESQGWLPAGWAIWSFKENVPLAPGQQLVVAITGAIDNTATYSQSINFNNSAYYALYDPTAFVNATSYPVPAAAIPTSHYLNGYKFAGYLGTAWAVSVSSPAFIIFKTEGVTPGEFATNTANEVPGLAATLPGRKVPIEWVVDGIEVYAQNPGTGTNRKRLTSTIDSGFITLTNAQGHTLYRNVDKEATEAIPENAGKLVTGYAADPSGIDAEASIKKGARIIYKDTNNSTNDFHEREKASLRD
jgi:hypothetical protein